ncbi:MAG TPA: hypothetical protein VM901_03225 [Bdellovibrionota bacterium]|jgi:hypothetical protein|nr:hypothetical protein [Bdellovibrionota bacterium]
MMNSNVLKLSTSWTIALSVAFAPMANAQKGFVQAETHDHDHDHEHEHGDEDHLAETAVVYAAHTAFEKHIKDNGLKDRDLVGFEASLEGEKVKAAIYTIPADEKIQKTAYECEVKRAEAGKLSGADCRNPAAQAIKNYTAAPALLPLAQFEPAVDAALAALETVKDGKGQVAKLDTIKSAKFWRSDFRGEPNLQVKFVWGENTTTFMMCHRHHGEEMDCHRQPKAGPNEPQD